MVDRKAHIQKMDARVRQWRAELDRLIAKADEAEADAKIGVQRRVSELQEKYSTVRARFDELVAAGEQAYERAKAAFDAAADEFSKAYERTKERTKRSNAATGGPTR